MFMKKEKNTTKTQTGKKVLKIHSNANRKWEESPSPKILFGNILRKMANQRVLGLDGVQRFRLKNVRKCDNLQMQLQEVLGKETFHHGWSKEGERRKAERQIILDLSLAFFLFGSCWPVKYVDKIYGLSGFFRMEIKV